MEKEEGISLLEILHALYFPDVSKKKVKAAIEKKACLINGKSERFASRKVKNGDRVEFDRHKLEEPIKVIPILMEDDYFIAVDKPPFVTVDEEEINRYFKKRVYLVHRLDKETSGVLLLVKRFEFKELFDALFRERSLKKIYRAICEGKVRPHEGMIEEPITTLSKKGGVMKMGVDPIKGKFARTLYRTLKEGSTSSYVECEPFTGRSHQIRVHLSFIGFPIVGDHLYGFQNSKAERIMLHAHSLHFTHPITEETIFIEAPLPEDFKACLEERGL